MTLSICLLTRNAEQNLDRALRSVAPLQAEVIVADTGSTDATVAVAQMLGARVVEVNWQDDFASAQNQVLDRARGEWILWINPDEEWVSADPGRIAALLARPEALAYGVLVREVIGPNNPGEGTEILLPRLFRRHPKLRYTGRLHPSFSMPLQEVAMQEGMQVYRTDLLICHHRYMAVLTEDKIRWANRLLELELADRPGQLHYQIEYGRNLLRLNDPRGHEVLAQAADILLAAKEAATPPTPTAASLLEYLLTVSLQQSRSRLTQEQVWQLCRKWFPKAPPLLWAQARQAFAAGQLRDAACLLEELIELGRTGTYDRSAAFDPAIMAEQAQINLGHCYLRLGELTRAEDCFHRMVSSPTHQSQAQKGLALVQQLRGDRLR